MCIDAKLLGKVTTPHPFHQGHEEGHGVCSVLSRLFLKKGKVDREKIRPTSFGKRPGLCLEKESQSVTFLFSMYI